MFLKIEIKPQLTKPPIRFALCVGLLLCSLGGAAHKLHPQLHISWAGNYAPTWPGRHLLPTPVANWQAQGGVLNYQNTFGAPNGGTATFATMRIKQGIDFNLVLYGGFKNSHLADTGAYLGLQINGADSGTNYVFRLYPNGSTNTTPPPKGGRVGFTSQIMVNIQGIAQQNGKFTLLFQWTRPGFAKMLGNQVYADVDINNGLGAVALLAREGAMAKPFFRTFDAYGDGVVVNPSQQLNHVAGIWHQATPDSVFINWALRPGCTTATHLRVRITKNNKKTLQHNATLLTPGWVATVRLPKKGLPKHFLATLFLDTLAANPYPVTTKLPQYVTHLNTPNPTQPNHNLAFVIKPTLDVRVRQVGNYIDHWLATWAQMPVGQSCCCYFLPSDSYLTQVGFIDTTQSTVVLPLHSEKTKWLKQTYGQWTVAQLTDTLQWPHPYLWPANELPHPPKGQPPSFLPIKKSTHGVFLESGFSKVKLPFVLSWLWGYQYPALLQNYFLKMPLNQISK